MWSTFKAGQVRAHSALTANVSVELMTVRDGWAVDILVSRIDGAEQEEEHGPRNRAPGIHRGGKRASGLQLTAGGRSFSGVPS
jgi:hypothetical protein